MTRIPVRLCLKLFWHSLLQAIRVQSSADRISLRSSPSDIRASRYVGHPLLILPETAWTIADYQPQFLIQADFDTSANRQDVTTSRRNMRLLEVIANTFVKATLQFCEHPTLCYTWPKFLPSGHDSFSPMWLGVVKNIKAQLSTIPILKTRHSKGLQKIGKAVILVPEFQDHNTEPLLDCKVKDPFVARGYPPDCMDALRQCGLKRPGSDLLFELVQLDLESYHSKMKSESTSAVWHSSIARLLIKYGPSHQAEVRKLALLPLRGGPFGAKFVTAGYGRVYLPTTEGIPIPRCVDLSVLEVTAVVNEDRKALFVKLGAVEALVANVRADVLHSRTLSKSTFWLGDSKEALCYLYLTHRPQNDQNELRDIFIHSADGRPVKPHQEDCYLPSTHTYGPGALFGGDHGAPKFRIAFANSGYLEDVPKSLRPDHPSWERWLYDYVGIRERVRLLSSSERNLSDAWIHVTEHLPDKVLGLLEYLWQFEGTKIASNSILTAMISKTDARKLCVKELMFPCVLQETYMPFPNLRRLREHFMEQHEQFPFLQIENLQSTETLSTKWMFLNTNFRVGKDDDWKFLMCILRWIKNFNPKASSVLRQQRVMDLYVAIDAKCTTELHTSLLSRFTL
jgi:hypothetical protein